MQVHGYTGQGSIDATIDGIRMTVPDDLNNRHRQLIADWEALGNTIPPYSEPTDTTINNAPDDLFGGPTLKEIFNGN